MNFFLAALPPLTLGHLLVLFLVLLGVFLSGFYFGYVQGRDETRALHERQDLYPDHSHACRDSIRFRTPRSF